MVSLSLYTGAILSGSKYILKLDTYSGVKLSFLLPLVFFAGAFVLNLGILTDKEARAAGVGGEVLAFVW